MFFEYVLILKYYIFCIFIATILFLVSVLLVFQHPDFEKISIYECGFYPFTDARNRFEIKFYVVAILFIIFDLEIVFLFPWVLNLNYVFYTSFFSMIFFLLILTIGFVYE